MRAFTMSGYGLGSSMDEIKANAVAKAAAANAHTQAVAAAMHAQAAAQAALAQQKQQNAGVALVGQYYPGSNASQLLDSSSYPQPQKSLLPWIIGGAVVLVLGGLFFFMRKR